VVGRADAVSNFFPDVDLTPHGALDTGVGRRHARLLVQGGALLVEDLDSTNGTFLNGARLAPRQPAPLGAGDELRLGNLALRVEL
jgi:pSer/pThr/pTyr-binding forkhead associated (FHA) protein